MEILEIDNYLPVHMKSIFQSCNSKEWRWVYFTFCGLPWTFNEQNNSGDIMVKAKI